MKKFLLLAMAAIVICAGGFVLNSCSSDDNPLVGTWVYTDEISGDTQILVFSKDGTGYINEDGYENINGNIETFSYTYDDDKKLLIMIWDDEDADESYERITLTWLSNTKFYAAAWEAVFVKE